MKSVQPPRTTRTIGEAQGYTALHISDRTSNDAVTGPDTPIMVTHWAPSAKELEVIAHGGRIQLTIVGVQHPPLSIGVWPDENS